MELDELLSNIDLVNSATYYNKTNLPSQISNALYNFGSYDTFEINAFIDASKQLDGSLGMIITPNEIYFNLNEQGSFKYKDIEKIVLVKHHHDNDVKTIINNYTFTNEFINVEALAILLSNITDIEITRELTNYEKVAYYTTIVINDIENEEYEDVILNDKQKARLKELKEELITIDKLDGSDYEYELVGTCNRAINLFDELELDSEEIDILIEVKNIFDNNDNQENEKIDNAKKYYDDMMNKYHQGDTSMFDQVKGIMANFGIDESDFEGKSMEEIEDMLCARFGISKSMFEKLASKFKG